MRTMKLYPVVKVIGQDLSREKKVVVPRQSMSLKEIISRFIKKEALPQSKEGVYEDRYDYDLEKLAKEDRVIQDEVIGDLKERTRDLNSRIKAHEKEVDAKREAQREAELEKRITDRLQKDPMSPKV